MAFRAFINKLDMTQLDLPDNQRVELTNMLDYFEIIHLAPDDALVNQLDYQDIQLLKLVSTPPAIGTTMPVSLRAIVEIMAVYRMLLEDRDEADAAKLSRG